MYWARSKALGAGQFFWLRLPLSCATDSYSCSSIQAIEFALDDADLRECRGACSAEQSIVTSAPAMSIFSTSVARWMPLVAARLALDPSVQNRNPPQRHAHRHGRAQQDVRLHFERFQVNVRLVKTVEQHQAVRAGVVELLCHVRQSW